MPEIEHIYSGFMGYPHMACVWNGNRHAGYVTDAQLVQVLSEYRPEQIVTGVSKGRITKVAIWIRKYDNDSTTDGS